jgi:hypothetical protein
MFPFLDYLHPMFSDKRMTTSKRLSGSRRVPYMTQIPGGPSFFDITTEINGSENQLCAL